MITRSFAYAALRALSCSSPPLGHGGHVNVIAVPIVGGNPVRPIRQRFDEAIG